jgi:hypothetical protein
VVEGGRRSFGGCLDRSDLAASESDDAVGGGGEACVVADREHRAAFVAARAQEGDDRGAAVFVQTSRWFVREDECRMVREGPGDCDALTFTAGKFRRPHVGLRTDADPVEQRRGARAARGVSCRFRA